MKKKIYNIEPSIKNELSNKKNKIFNIMYKLWGNPNELFFYLIYVILYSINLYLYKNKIWTFLSVINNFY